MLVLGRKVGEKILVDNKLIIINLGTNQIGETILGFDGPKEIEVNRLEVHCKKMKSKQEEGEDYVSSCKTSW